MENLWTRLPSAPPFVLEEDRPYVEAWNAVRGTDRERVRLRLEVPPEPFIGPRDAPLLVLARNPGFAAVTPSDFASDERVSAVLGGVSDANVERTHFYLTDLFAGTAGAAWWKRCLRRVAEHASMELAELAHKVLVVEYHGYHSEDWAFLPVTLPSQWYGFDLVRRAVERGAVIVITRGGKDWDVAVPELRTYSRRFATNTVRISSISPGNMPPDAFEQVVQAVSD